MSRPDSVQHGAQLATAIKVWWLHIVGSVLSEHGSWAPIIFPFIYHINGCHVSQYRFMALKPWSSVFVDVIVYWSFGIWRPIINHAYANSRSNTPQTTYRDTVHRTRSWAGRVLMDIKRVELCNLVRALRDHTEQHYADVSDNVSHRPLSAPVFIFYRSYYMYAVKAVGKCLNVATASW